MADKRFIRIQQNEICDKPAKWVEGGPGALMEMPDRAKRVYLALHLLAYSLAGNSKDQKLANGHALGKGWFWTSHMMIKQLTNIGPKSVQRGIKELVEGKLLEYHPSKGPSGKCYFKLVNTEYKKSGAGKGSAPQEASQDADSPYHDDSDLYPEEADLTRRPANYNPPVSPPKQSYPKDDIPTV